MRRSPTKKMNTDNGGENLLIKGAMSSLPIDEYSEQPRPNLYNVIKKLRDQKGKQFHRLTYVAKLDESNFRGDFEKEFTQWVDNVVNNQDENEVPLDEGLKFEHSGFAVVLGPWHVHMLEAEQTLMYRFVNHLSKAVSQKSSHYSNVWVLNYTEDVPSRAYHNWYCKTVPAQSATREIKGLQENERVEAIYESMCQIGHAA